MSYLILIELLLVTQNFSVLDPFSPFAVAPCFVITVSLGNKPSCLFVRISLPYLRACPERPGDEGPLQTAGLLGVRVFPPGLCSPAQGCTLNLLVVHIPSLSPVLGERAYSQCTDRLQLHISQVDACLHRDPFFRHLLVWLDWIRRKEFYSLENCSQYHKWKQFYFCMSLQFC